MIKLLSPQYSIYNLLDFLLKNMGLSSERLKGLNKWGFKIDFDIALQNFYFQLTLAIDEPIWELPLI